MANALARETSPYLLQHRENPVDWRPWGPEALAEARERDVPLLVSIGYSACHWCHVMERESFEDSETAGLMNARFVNVKVDREERPDVDALYMEAVQAMTGQGGWPLNVFVTPDQVPFFGGTYFPPAPRAGMPSWRQVLGAVAEAWEQRRESIEQQSEQIVQRLRGAARITAPGSALTPLALETAVERLRELYDPIRGGWGSAPKFPAASTIDFLLAVGEPEMALRTLQAMAAGGIYDQVGGGFHRYSVDAAWRVPHFEKMLYDNALLARAYLHGWQVSGEQRLREVAEETLDWALREMRGPEGGFYSALDADSDGEEGRFYTWTPQELEGADVESFQFEGRRILLAGVPAGLRERLLALRDERVRPGTDDKRLTSWNALMVSALADAGAVLERADYLEAARATGDFLLTTMRPEGQLLRTYNRGQAKLPGLLADHAFLLEALLTLYEATFEDRWFVEAWALAATIAGRFADPDGGGFWSTPPDHELLARRKDLEDTPIPSGGSSAALGLLRLAALTGDHALAEPAIGLLALLHEAAPRFPTAFGHLLQAIDFHLSPTREVALVGDDVRPLERAVRARLRPHVVLAGGPEAADPAVPLLAGRTRVDGHAAAYVCENFACRVPVTDPNELEALLQS
ncbi:MAG TPA: thioredoxin domain-containing protein [Solirubrobacteraceae bacterium]|nr:thioredoxin domain-containing protein [Solirubrobacteraceae bacterium]